MKIFDVYPLYNIEIAKANGADLWDETGKHYLDMYGGHAVISIGHTNPHYVETLTNQLSNIGFYSNSVKIPSQQRLANLLGELSGKNDYQLFLCNSGAEANENALKLASFHTGKKKIISFTKGFHGRTSLAVAATDIPSIVAPVNQTDNIICLPFNDIEALKKCFAEEGQNVAAVIIEAIQGVGGIKIATTQFLTLIRELCDKNGALMIADEVQCGCGRTGKYFAMDNSNINADIYSMAKGIGNGFPIGAIMIAPHISPKHGMLGTTFGGNHLAVAAAIAVAEVIKKDNLMQNAKDMGNYITKELTGVKGITDIRGEGLMLGIDLDENAAPFRKQLIDKHHIFVGSASTPETFRLLPTLNITKQQVDTTISAIKELLK